MNGVKKEVDLGVTEEHFPPTSVALLDDDEDEDTGELHIPSSLRGIWLTWIPRMLWDSWANFQEDEEIQIGLVRVWSPVGSERKVF